MTDDPTPNFLDRLLLDAQLIERGSDHLPSQPSSLPWHWPLGARRLLAILILIAAIAISSSGRGYQAEDSPRNPVPDLILDVNTAPARVLGALPHIGPALVRKWTAAREQRPFESLDDLQARVKGLGPVGMARIAPHIRVENTPRESSTSPTDDTEP
jgi:hypothetical protein